MYMVIQYLQPVMSGYVLGIKIKGEHDASDFYRRSGIITACK
jgi:hypothetical protein